MSSLNTVSLMMKMSHVVRPRLNSTDSLDIVILDRGCLDNAHLKRMRHPQPIAQTHKALTLLRH